MGFNSGFKGLKFHYNLTSIAVLYMLCTDICAFVIVSRTVLLRMRNVSDESCRENQTTHCTYSKSSPPPENRPFGDIMWENMIEPDGPHMIVQGVRARVIQKYMLIF